MLSISFSMRLLSKVGVVFDVFDSIIFVVSPLAFANITTCQNYPVQLANNLQSSTTYSWSPAQGLNANNISGPIATPDQTTTYTLTASFENIGGLKPKAPVRSAGVVVGRVATIDYDRDLICRTALEFVGRVTA